MKLIKLVAVSALISSAVFASKVTESNAQVQKVDVAGGCPTWPYCRDVDFADQALESTTQLYTAQQVNKTV